MIHRLSSILLTIFLLTTFTSSFAQYFPQQAINNALQNRVAAPVIGISNQNAPMPSDLKSGVKQLLARKSELLSPILSRTDFNTASSSSDTIFVGAVPNDTLVINGTFYNNGPILVFNDGVLIFENANATIMGDLYVFQNGKMFADNSTLSFPQLYFYQRSWVLAHNGYVEVNNCTLDFTGLSHNLLTVNNSQIVMHNIQNLGFTTASAYGQASITIDSTNQAGEYILTDSATYNFSNANTVLLWHTVPDNAVINMTFPAAGAVSNYTFNSATPGVTGINYNVLVNNSTDIMWALMPSNGSDVTISGSTIRAIGLWFERGDTANVSGLVNNSSYSTFTAPLNDRLLQLNNCSVQTWSLYVFDTSDITISSSIVGEVGSMGRSYVTAQGVFCDGSGGYYWANDTSFSIAISSTVLTTIRSQGNGIFLFGYGSVNGSAEAIGNSVLVVTQSSVPQDPVPYEHSIVWRIQINPTTIAYVNSVVDVNGSAWIDQGPLGSFMDFGSYDLFYSTSLNPSAWIPISVGNITEVHNAFLAQWNTQALTPGAYNLRLNTFNNSGDSIDAVRQVTLLPSTVSIDEMDAKDQITVYPNPASSSIEITFNNNNENEIKFVITNSNGKQIFSKSKQMLIGKQSMRIPISDFAEGTYFYNIVSDGFERKGKFVIAR